MSKKSKYKAPFSFSRVLPLLMVMLGLAMILFWLPVWIWFVLLGVALILFGFNIYN